MFGDRWAADARSGVAQAKAGTFALADQDNHAGSDDEGHYNEAGNDEIYAGHGENVVAGDAQALGTDSESVAKARSHNHADGDEGNEAGNDEIYAGWNNDSISGDVQAIADGHAESDSVNKAEGTNSEAGNDLILAGGGGDGRAGDSQAIPGAGSAAAFGPHEADDHGGNDADRHR